MYGEEDVGVDEETDDVDGVECGEDAKSGFFHRWRRGAGGSGSGDDLCVC